ncbi:MAG: hypothetical protein OEM25_07665 [Gammaproteobacteria bacterium]|nr:hypothetical protein [Gammaproteobacteria bacterium]
MSTEDETSHEQKRERMCQVMAECCGDMSAEGKKQMLHDMMPRMMKMMGGGGRGGMMGMMMREFMRAFRWVPLIPIVVGSVLFALGYFLDAEAVRILWLVLAALPIVLGVFGFVMISVASRTLDRSAPTA